MLNTTQNPPRQTLPNGTFFDMIPVEAGTFMMGSEDNDRSKPVHKVRVSTFYIGKVPITQALWKAVMGADKNLSAFQGDKRPVERVSWYDAAVFCNALNALCGYEPTYFRDAQCTQPYGKIDNTFTLPNEPPVFHAPQAKGYRLPTEAEWEFAAIGGNRSGGYTYAGGENLQELGWYDGNSYDKTMPVGLKMYNELGIHDMSGNVWEWCSDVYSDYTEVISSSTVDAIDGAIVNPTGVLQQGVDRVLRGGSWSDQAGHCRPTFRLNDPPAIRFDNFGFRLVLSSLSV